MASSIVPRWKDDRSLGVARLSDLAANESSALPEESSVSGNPDVWTGDLIARHSSEETQAPHQNGPCGR